MRNKNKIVQFIGRWPEFLTIPFALLLWKVSPRLLHELDPVAASFDAGVLQIILFAVVGMLIFSGVAFLIIKWNFKSVFKDYSIRFKDLWLSITPFQKIIVLLSLYLGLLHCFCLLASAL